MRSSISDTGASDRSSRAGEASGAGTRPAGPAGLLGPLLERVRDRVRASALAAQAATSPVGTFRPDIEGLRAIAVLLVVAYHAEVPGITGGYVGVDVFFVLSGYLITGLLMAEARRSGRVDLLGFYARRARRLLPALGLVLAITVALGVVVFAPFEQRLLANAAIATSAYLSNVWFAALATDYLAANAHTNPLLHAWSLGVEEQFYLLWPLLILALLAWPRGGDARVRERRVAWTLAVVLVGSFVCAVVLTGTRQPWAFFLLPGRAWEFALGALGAVVATEPVLRRWSPAQAAVAGGGLIAVLGGVAVTFGESTRFPGPYAAVPALATLGVLLLGSAWPQGPLVRALAVPPLQTLGRLSYGWYLWHWPVLVFGVALVGPLPLGARVGLLVLALGLAELSYRYVEHPVRYHRRLATPPRALALAAVITLGGLLAGAVWREIALAQGDAPGQKRFTRARQDIPTLYRSDCQQDLYSVRVDPDACATGPADAPHTVVLLGDSHAAQWYPTLEAFAAEQGWRLVPMTKPDCPAVDEPKYSHHVGRRYVECERWRESALDALEALRPDLTVLASSTAQPYTAAQWRAGTDRVLQRAAGASRAVVQLRDTPIAGFDVPTCLGRRAWARRLVPRPDCDMADALAAGAPVFEVLRAAAAAYPNVYTLDLTDLVCAGGVCVPDPGGRLAYRDDEHLRASVARDLAPELTRRLADELNGDGFSVQATALQATIPDASPLEIGSEGPVLSQ